MDTLTPLRRASLTVVCAPHAAREQANLMAASLAVRGPLTVLDCGNRLQPYRIAQWLRQRTPDVAAAAGRITVRRAFTCYQALALLENTPALSQPCLILDLLASFYDDQVPLPEARRLLNQCLRQVTRLHHHAPVLVTLAPPAITGRDCLAETLCAHADYVLLHEAPAPDVFQPSLFPDFY